VERNFGYGFVILEQTPFHVLWGFHSLIEVENQSFQECSLSDEKMALMKKRKEKEENTIPQTLDILHFLLSLTHTIK